MFKKLLQNDFLRHNLIFFLGTLSFSFFNYLFYPIIGRILPVSGFGEVQSLITLYMQFGVIFTAFGYLIINILNNHSDETEKKIILTELERIAIFLSLVVGSIIIVISPILASALKFNDITAVMSLAPLLVITVPYTFRLYYMQSKLKLSKVSIANLIYSIGKLLTASLLILLGIQVAGAIWGYIVALTITWFYLYKNSHKDIPFSKFNLPILLRGKKYSSEKTVIKQQTTLGLFVVTILFGLTFLYTADVIFVRKFFSPEISGLYSGISTVARIIYFLTASVVGVLLASVNNKSTAQENNKLLGKSVVILLCLGLVGVFGFYLLPNFIINTLMGFKFIPYVSLLVPLGIVMLISSIVNLIYTYHLSTRRYLALLPILLSILIFFVLIMLNHKELFDIIIDLAIANIFALVGGLLLLWRKK